MQSTTSRKYFWAVRCRAHPGRMCRCRLTSRSYYASIFDVDAAALRRFNRTVRYDEPFVLSRQSDYDYVLGEKRNSERLIEFDNFLAEEQLALEEEEYGGVNFKRWRSLGTVPFPVSSSVGGSRARFATSDVGECFGPMGEPTVPHGAQDDLRQLIIEQKTAMLQVIDGLAEDEEDEEDEEEDEEAEEEVLDDEEAEGCAEGGRDIKDPGELVNSEPNVSEVDEAMQGFVADADAITESFVTGMQSPVNIFWLICSNVSKLSDAIILAAVERLVQLAPRMSVPGWARAYSLNKRGDQHADGRVSVFRTRAKKLIASDARLRRWAAFVEL